MHVIVVDDQASNRALCRLILEGITDKVTLLSNGQELVDILPDLTCLPDAILLDVMMPIKDGFTAASEVRELFPQHHIPIIFLTALDDHTSFEQCLSLGDDFILKPVDRNVIQAKVQAHCRIARMHNQVKVQRDELEVYRSHVEYEHSVAESIFENLKQEMSAHLECISGIDYLSTSKTLFNGDLIIAAQRPSGGAYIMVADATGHGLPAAISTLPAARAFFTMAGKGLPLGEMVTELNSVMERFLPSGMMLAANVFEIKANGFDIVYWAGGLPDSYLLNSDGSIAHTIVSRHMPLGVLDNSSFEVNIDSLQASSDQKLCCFTDGVIEAKNHSNQLYGEDRLKHVLRSNPITISSIYESVRTFSRKSVDDDLSILLLSFPLLNTNEHQQNNSTAVSFLPCTINIRFDATTLRNLNAISEVRRTLQGFIMGEHLDLVCTVLSELLSNAIDHGLLELCSEIKAEPDGFFLYFQQQQEKLKQLGKDKWLKLSLDIDPQIPELNIVLEHNGKGFDYQATSLDLGEHGEYGRGMFIVEQLCESVEYSKYGRYVHAIYRF